MSNLRYACRMLRINLGFWLGVPLLILSSLCLSPFTIWKLRRKNAAEQRAALRMHIFRHGLAWARLMRLTAEVRCVMPETPTPEPCILVANHQSALDPYCFAFQPVTSLAFIVRNWPFRLPVYGTFMKRAGYLNSERLHGEQLLDAAEKLLREGASVIFFPEGTRSISGLPGRFHAGAFLLAMRTNTPVVPVCFNGTGRMLPKGSLLLRPEPFTVRLLPPVRPEEFAAHGEEGYRFLRRRVKENLLKALEAPAIGDDRRHVCDAL